MNDFDEKRLEKYNDERKTEMLGKVRDIKESLNDVKETIRLIKTAEDDVEILSHAKKAHKRLNMLEIRYMGLLTIKRKMGMIDDSEYESLLNDISGDKYENAYPSILNHDMDEVVRKVKLTDFTPDRGTPAYCDCKGYYDISRIDMGKMIKKDLTDRYPTLGFSVKTEGNSRWNDRATVRITKTQPGILNEYGGFKDEFIRELRTFLEEYEPRMKIGVYTYRW